MPAVTRAVPFVLGLIFIALGSCFAWWMLRTYGRVAPSYRWPEVRATVLDSRLEEFQPTPNSPPEFRLAVRYRYPHEGAIFHSSQVRSRVKPYLRRADAEEDLARWAPGAQVPAWVDPGRPDYALLERDSRAVLYATAFPLIVIVLGLGILWRSLRPSTRPPSRLLQPK